MFEVTQLIVVDCLAPSQNFVRVCLVYYTFILFRTCLTLHALQARVPQELHRSVAFGAPHMSDVQNGHPEALRVCGQCPVIPQRI